MPGHSVLLHPVLCFSGFTERMLATARALAAAGRRVTIVSAPGTRSRAVEEEGFAVRYAELPRDPLRAPFAAWRTRRLLARLEPDVLHATHDSLAELASTLGATLGVPWVLELHLPALGPVARTLRGLACAVAASESLVAGVVNHGGVPRARVRVVKNAPRPCAPAPLAPAALDETPPPAVRAERDGRDGPRREPRGADRSPEPPEEPGPPGPPLVGCSGLLDGAHATTWFLEAARLCVAEGSPAMFAVLGEGPNEGRLRRFVRERGLSERVTIAVPTTRDAGESLAALDVHVSCRGEGGPGWLACEALARGVPSVLAACGDAYDLVQDGETAVLVEESSPRRLADEVRALLADPAAARRMGARGRERMLADAPPEEFARAVAEIHDAAATAPVA